MQTYQIPDAKINGTFSSLFLLQNCGLMPPPILKETAKKPPTERG